MNRVILSLCIFYFVTILSLLYCNTSLANNDCYEQKNFDESSIQNSGLYIALGDSFAAGLGAKDYILSSGNCFRSRNAFSIDEVYGIANIFNFTPKFYACSGATTKTLLKYQIEKHKSLFKKAKLITVVIGGNNVNFAEVLTFCLFNKDCQNYFSNKLISLQKTIDNQIYKLTNTFKKLKKVSPNAQILVLGYPYLFNRNYNEFCDINRFIELEEQEFLNNMTDRLNHVIENAALNAGINYLSVTEAFSGHEICSEDSWISSFDPTENALIESFHPNARGQKAYADVIKQAIIEHIYKYHNNSENTEYYIYCEKNYFSIHQCSLKDGLP